MKLVSILIAAALALTACASGSGGAGADNGESEIRGRDTGHSGNKGRSGFRGSIFPPPAGR